MAAEPRTFTRGTPWIGLLALLLMVMLASPTPARGADLEIIISTEGLQKIFESAAPFKLAYELIPGQTAAKITLSHPKVILEPGQPGRVFLEMDYQGESSLLGLKPFQGRTRPEISLEYVPEKGVVRMKLTQFTIQVSPQSTLKLDGFIKPTDLPLTSRPADRPDR